MTDQKETSQKIGCAIWIFIIIIFASIIGGISKCNGPFITVSGDTGTIAFEAKDYYTPDILGNDIAKMVYNAAKKNENITRIVIRCQLVGTQLSDKYGNTVKGPYVMGDIVQDDLAEVRRYNSEDDYAYSQRFLYAMQLRRLNYSEFLAK